MIHLYNVYDTDREDTAIYENMRTFELQEVRNNTVVFTAPVARIANHEALRKMCGPLLCGIYADGDKIVRLDKNGNLIS